MANICRKKFIQVFLFALVSWKSHHFKQWKHQIPFNQQEIPASIRVVLFYGHDIRQCSDMPSLEEFIHLINDSEVAMVGITLPPSHESCLLYPTGLGDEAFAVTYLYSVYTLKYINTKLPIERLTA